MSSRRSGVLRAAASVAILAIGLVLAQPASAATAAGTAVEYRLPFEAGQSFPINQGWHGAYSHFGLSAYAYDFGLPEGTPVVAAAAGVVAFVQDGERACGGRALRNDANSVTIYHADGTATLYAHLSTIRVTVGRSGRGTTVAAFMPPRSPTRGRGAGKLAQSLPNCAFHQCTQTEQQLLAVRRRDQL